MTDRPLTPEQAKLAARYHRLASLFGRSFAYRHGFDPEDIHSHLNEIVCRFARDFDPSRGVCPDRYFAWKLKRALIEYLRHEMRQRQIKVTCSLDTHYHGDIDAVRRYGDGDFLAAERNDLRSLEDCEFVEHLLRRLPPDRATLLRRHYLDGESREELAGELGMNIEAVDRRLGRAAARLRDSVNP